MERLTYRSPKFNNPVSNGACKDITCSDECDSCKINDLIAKLCAYEDTGLEPEEIKGFAEDVAYQFGYYFPIKDILYISTGGLSTLEWAFRILGWNDPHPVPECECEFPGCHKHATCGTPTKDGYKRVCGKHFAELTREDAEAAMKEANHA